MTEISQGLNLTLYVECGVSSEMEARMGTRSYFPQKYCSSNRYARKRHTIYRNDENAQDLPR